MSYINFEEKYEKLTKKVKESAQKLVKILRKNRISITGETNKLPIMILSQSYSFRYYPGGGGFGKKFDSQYLHTCGDFYRKDRLAQLFELGYLYGLSQSSHEYGYDDIHEKLVFNCDIYNITKLGVDYLTLKIMLEKMNKYNETSGDIYTQTFLVGKLIDTLIMSICNTFIALAEAGKDINENDVNSSLGDIVSELHSIFKYVYHKYESSLKVYKGFKGNDPCKIRSDIEDYLNKKDQRVYMKWVRLNQNISFPPTRDQVVLFLKQNGLYKGEEEVEEVEEEGEEDYRMGYQDGVIDTIFSILGGNVSRKRIIKMFNIYDQNVGETVNYLLEHPD
jgi:hypothetical protein